ncbi:hypothetical protein OUZ56_024215 [Daphnia magna]|uniref:THAP-type domain-containing protein n=1 Tax=Daphnia magna TaxID=35525 RepID=A0ABR0B0C2_9CRUS|nr:hypothetical protein OUZ56_024215 [Daphnia magna]
MTLMKLSGNTAWIFKTRKNGPNGSRKDMEQHAGVGSGAKITEKRARLFRTPKDEVVLKLWAQKIPTKPHAKLTASSRICENHFGEKDIIKNDEIIIGVQVIQLPNWKLKTVALPNIFEESTCNLLPAETPKRKAPLEHKPLGDISNYKEHCPSPLIPKKKKQALDRKTELDCPIPQQELSSSFMEGTALFFSDMENQPIPLEHTTVKEYTTLSCGLQYGKV